MPLNNTKEVQAMQLPIQKLRPFENHPFQVKDDDEMNQLVWSVLTQGVLTPLVVRPLENGEYEVISGHRRLRACQKAGIETVPALIYALDRDAAAIALVDSNLHREKILPSEKAFAFRLDDLRKFFPRSYTPARIQERIMKLLEADCRKRQRAQER